MKDVEIWKSYEEIQNVSVPCRANIYRAGPCQHLRANIFSAGPGHKSVDPPDPRVLFLVGEVPFTLEGTIWKLES